MTEKEEERWSEIKRTFKRNLLFRGADEADPMIRVLMTLSSFYEAGLHQGGPGDRRDPDGKKRGHKIWDRILSFTDIPVP